VSRGPSGCRRVQERLPRLLDASLPPLEEARDRGHLEACAACRDRRREHRGLLRSIRRASAPDPVEVGRVASAVRAALARAPGPRRARAAPPRWGWALAAGILWALALQGGPFLAGRGAPVGPDPWLEHLPGWSAARGGVAELARWLGGETP